MRTSSARTHNIQKVRQRGLKLRTSECATTHLVCTHGHLDVLLADLVVPDVADVVPGQLQYVCRDVLQYGHDVQRHVVVDLVA